MGKSEDNGVHRRMLLSSDALARVYGGPMGDQLKAFMPALWERNVRRSLKGVLGEGFSGTA